MVRHHWQYFFKNESRTVPVNGERYRDRLREFLFPEIDEIDEDDIFFQQDIATCHTAAVTNGFIREKFDEPIISPNGEHNWPTKS